MKANVLIKNLAACCGLAAVGTLTDMLGQGNGSFVYQNPPGIIYQSQVQRADGVTVFNYVAPHQIPAVTPAPTATPLPGNSQKSRSGTSKPLELIMLSATVYDHQYTDLRIWEGSDQCRVFSNIDFTYFTGITEIETADVIYDFLLMIDEESSKSLTQLSATTPNYLVTSLETTSALLSQAQQQLPILSANANAQAQYFVVENPNNHATELFTTVKALHFWYDANHIGLVAAYNQRQAEQAVAAAYASTHPPASPPPVVINYWPIKNSRYLTTGTGGKNQ